jgi:hypothetical protein
METVMKRHFRNISLVISIAFLSTVLLPSCGGRNRGRGRGVAVEEYVTDGVVKAIAVAPDGTTYIGGSFTHVGPMTGGGVPIDAASGKKRAAFPKVT